MAPTQRVGLPGTLGWLGRPSAGEGGGCGEQGAGKAGPGGDYQAAQEVHGPRSSPIEAKCHNRDPLGHILVF